MANSKVSFLLRSSDFNHEEISSFSECTKNLDTYWYKYSNYPYLIIYICRLCNTKQYWNELQLSNYYTLNSLFIKNFTVGLFNTLHSVYLTFLVDSVNHSLDSQFYQTVYILITKWTIHVSVMLHLACFSPILMSKSLFYWLFMQKILTSFQ